MTLMRKENDADLNLIPYKGRRPAQPGHPGRRHRHRHPAACLVQPAHPRQKVRPIAVTGEKRTPALPEHARR
jgi:hypothetical protein